MVLRSDVVAVPPTTSLLDSLHWRPRHRPTSGRDRCRRPPAHVRDHYSGLLVNGHDKSQWADALATILDDHDKDQNGQ